MSLRQHSCAPSADEAAIGDNDKQTVGQPVHRELPLPSRATVRRASQPRLHALSCQFRRARLRPTGQDDRVEVFYWSLWKERWTKAAPFGRTELPLDQALTFIASEDIFRAIR